MTRLPAAGRFLRTALTAAPIACAMAAMCACGSHGPAGKRQYLVAFSQCDGASPYHAAQSERMGKLLGAYRDARLTIEDAQGDSATQVAQIEAFIQRKPDLLIVAPNDREAITEVMGKAMRAHIPTICLGQAISAPNYVTRIHSDNAMIGRMAGELIVQRLIRKYGRPVGSVVEMRGVPGEDYETDRDAGAKAVFAMYPNIEVVAEPVADWSEAKAHDRMIEVLHAYPVVDVVYGHNDPMAFGAYQAARELERERGIAFVGVDGLGGPTGGIKGVLDGVLEATFLNPLGADEAVEIGNRMMRQPGFRPEADYAVRSETIIPDNASDWYVRMTRPAR